jgi:general secretion pathway protein J
MMYPANTQRGMTLIEVTVALLLIALLSTGLITEYRAGQRTYSQVVKADTGEKDILIAQRFLRTVIESTYPGRAKETQAETSAFEGRSDDIALVSLVSRGGKASGHDRVEVYTLARRDGFYDLVVRVGLPVDRRDGDLERRNAGEELLIQRVAAVDWSFLPRPDPEKSDERPQWAQAWTSSAGIPELVRLVVQFPPGDGRVWPEFVASPLVTDEAACEFDPVGQTCREMPR